MPRAPESFVVGRERGAAVLSSGNGQKADMVAGGVVVASVQPPRGSLATGPGAGGRLGWWWPGSSVLSLPLLRPYQNECAAVGVPLPGLGDVALHPLPAAALAGVLERAEQSKASCCRRQAANQAAQEGLG